MKSNLIITSCAVALVFLAVALVALTVQPAVTTVSHTESSSYSWYFKPRENGRQPVVADNATFLSQYDNVRYLGSPDSKDLFLTFEDVYKRQAQRCAGGGGSHRHCGIKSKGSAENHLRSSFYSLKRYRAGKASGFDPLTARHKKYGQQSLFLPFHALCGAFFPHRFGSSKVLLWFAPWHEYSELVVSSVFSRLRIPPGSFPGIRRFRNLLQNPLILLDLSKKTC